MNILVSCCLLGEACRYDARSQPCLPLLELGKRTGVRLIPVCPEQLGGLPTPRPPAEIQWNGRVVNRAGQDVTDAYQLGARLALETARKEGCTLAVLKARSPSCGSREIYDGTFTGRLIPGMGMTARLLSEQGIRVLDETQLQPLLEKEEGL